MKTKFLLLALISIVIISCNKKDDKDDDPINTPTPELSLRFGYVNDFYEFIPFADQTSIGIDSIAPHSNFGISVTETNLADVGGLTTNDLIFKFEISTKDDFELYDNKLNTGSSSSYVGTFGSRSELGADFGLPYKLGSIDRKSVV